MPNLTRRGAKPLLSRVNGKPHATQDDHFDPLPTPPDSTRTSSSMPKREETEEDINAEPVSSDDEVPVRKEFKVLDAKPAGSSQASTSSSFRYPQVDGSNDKAPKRKPFRLPGAVTSESTGTKRSSPASEHPSSDSSHDGTIFKKQKYNPNIHVQVPKRKGPKPAAKTQQYGYKAQRQRSREEQKEKINPLKMPKQPEEKTQEKRKFKIPKGMLEFQGTIDASAGAADAEGSPSLSSLSSPPSSPGLEEIAALDLPDAGGPYIPKTECAICGTQVELYLKQDFEDQFNKGKKLNYKWQQRFCRYHKQASAREQWKERNYPQIDWDGFLARLQKRRHTSHVKRVISGEVESVYRKQLEETLKKGGTKSLMQAMNDDEAGGRKGGGGGVGYYGPRGEKLMTEHILTNFADALRSHASKDRLISAAGVSGGVSGFVQAVLVPELAVSLVLEDLGPKGGRSAVEVLAESGELGELLNPAQEDKIRVSQVEEDEVED